MSSQALDVSEVPKQDLEVENKEDQAKAETAKQQRKEQGIKGLLEPHPPGPPQETVQLHLPTGKILEPRRQSPSSTRGFQVPTLIIKADPSQVEAEEIVGNFDYSHVLQNLSSRNTSVRINASSIFEAIIEGYIRAGQVKPAIDAFDKMLKYGCHPTMKMYLCIIGHVVTVKRHRVSLLLYKRMTNEGLSANVTVFSALIHGYCHVGQLREAHQLLEEMKKVGLAPDEAIYNCLIETFSKVGRYYMAQTLIIEMRDAYGLSPSLVAYNSLIEALCKDRKIVAAYRLFVDMRRAGIAPVVDTFNIILEGFFRMNGVTRAIKVYKQMPRYNCMPNMETEKIMVAGFSRCGKLARAMHFLDSVVAAGRNVDVVGCNHILHALSLTRMTKAEEFLKKMIDGVCTPDAISYTTLMHGYCRAGRLDDAERMFQMMKSKGCKPTGVSYEALIVSYCRVERLQAASDLADELIEGGYHMNAATCSAILDGLSRAGLVDHALKIIDYVTDHKIFVDPDKLVTLLRALHKVDRGPEGKDVLRGMAKKGCLQEPYASMF
ncbi:hypothetical protein L7F22_055846 [Adiantum nelumboides]|nr:hypothetical protein [Adiantum nelumboides]